ncbi:MAG: polysaccharide biosynthesis tyrosine autokinase [Lachnospiraceae bacterium]|nr:polysaccharide biosynthesis tyrosine autokinase [Lachnospiraceae bacterium]
MDRNYNKSNESKEGLIDITGIIDDMIKGALRMKWRFLALIVICTVLFCGYQRLTYSPSYVASSTFTISSSISTESSNTYIDNESANQMAKTFPYILKSGILKSVVAEDLGLKKIPGKISADVMADTNLFTLSVTADDPEMANKILQSVVENYPSVAEFVIGSSQLYLMDETGVPTEPDNPFSYKHEIMIGILIGIALCFILDLLFSLGKNTVRKEEDIKKLFSVKSLGIMPHAKFNKRRKEVEELIVLDNPRLPKNFLEAVRTVRRRIERASKESGMKSFLVTSAMPGEGKSTVSANIALALSMKGYKVILVDADLRNPSTAKVLGMKEKEIGSLEVIKGEASIDEAAQAYKDTGVMILAGSTPIQDTSSVLSGKNMREFIKELEKRADFVIIDTPPSALLADAAIVAQYVDGAVFVVRQDYTEIDRILDGMEILSGSGVTINGCILNDVSASLGEANHHSHSYHTKVETA